VLPADKTLDDADYEFAEAYAAWLGASDVARFSDDEIRREGLPEDVFELLHDIAYHLPGRNVYGYVSRAQEILRSTEFPAEHDSGAARSRVSAGKFQCLERGICDD
jgi:hypothetical protein